MKIKSDMVERAKSGQSFIIPEQVNDAYIIAHNEDLTLLLAFLADNVPDVQVVRGPYPEGSAAFSAIIRCLINHANAWQRIVDSGRTGLIVEADFVPCRNMFRANIEVPRRFVASGLLYLYACSPELWEVFEQGMARGHAGGAVAYVVHPDVARLMLQYRDEHLRANPEGAYHGWDSEIGYWLKRRGVESYVPARNFGEHGGLQNPEHARNDLPRPHRADSLIGALAFRPAYAEGSPARLPITRLKARLWGVLRLFAGRLFPYHCISRDPKNVLAFLARRFVLRWPGI